MRPPAPPAAVPARCGTSRRGEAFLPCGGFSAAKAAGFPHRRPRKTTVQKRVGLPLGTSTLFHSSNTGRGVSKPLGRVPAAESPGRIPRSNPRVKSAKPKTPGRGCKRAAPGALRQSAFERKIIKTKKGRRSAAIAGPFLHAEPQSRRALSGATARRAGPEKTGLWPALPPPRSRPLWGLTAPC